MHIINTFRNYCKKKIQFFQKDMRILSTFAAGKMAEWSIASVLKTDDCNRSGGSNPSLSAKSNPFSYLPSNRASGVMRRSCFR